MTTLAGITTRGGAVFAKRPDWAGRGGIYLNMLAQTGLEKLIKKDTPGLIQKARASAIRLNRSRIEVKIAVNDLMIMKQGMLKSWKILEIH